MVAIYNEEIGKSFPKFSKWSFIVIRLLHTDSDKEAIIPHRSASQEAPT